jgi:glycosyl transferase family 25
MEWDCYRLAAFAGLTDFLYSIIRKAPCGNQVSMRLPPVFVISLRDSPRRKSIRQKLEKWPGEWSFVDAVDGQTLSPQDLATNYDPTTAFRRNGRPLALSEIGCALSHRRIYQGMIDRGLDRAIILEDDAILRDSFSEFPFYTIGVEFDVISFFSEDGLIRRRPAKYAGDVRLYRAVGIVHNTVGYLISRRGAEKLLAATRIIKTVADWPIYPTHISFFLAVPYLVDHDVGPSTIAADRRATDAPPVPANRLLSRMTGGMMAYVTVPLFLKYFLYRDYYNGPFDYYWREIEREVKLILSLYTRLGRDGRRR